MNFDMKYFKYDKIWTLLVKFVDVFYLETDSENSNLMFRNMSS